MSCIIPINNTYYPNYCLNSGVIYRDEAKLLAISNPLLAVPKAAVFQHLIHLSFTRILNIITFTPVEMKLMRFNQRIIEIWMLNNLVFHTHERGVI